MAAKNVTIQKTIAGMWEEVDIEFQQKSGKNLKTGSPVGIQDITRKLHENYVSEDAQKGRETREKIVGVLGVLSKLAKVGGDIAASAFPAANFCFGAVAFLLELPGKGTKIYESIAALFAEVDAFLAQYSILARVEKVRVVHAELIENTQRLLLSFVKMIGWAYKFIEGSGWVHLKAMSKVALLRNDKIKKELENFVSITKAQSLIYEALTYEHGQKNEKAVGDISKDLNTVVVDINDRRARESINDQLERVRKELVTEDEVKLQKKLLNTLSDGRVDGTGDWLRSIEAYQQWTDHSTIVHPLLMISGKRSSGKTQLIPTILDHLDLAIMNGARISHAYYFFDRQDVNGRTDDGPKHAALLTAIRHMAFQLAKQNKSYVLDLAASFATKRPDLKKTSIKKLWSDLRLGSARSDITQVLIFDGLDVLPDRALTALLSLLTSQQIESLGKGAHSAEKASLRVLITGKAETFKGQALIPLIDMADSEYVDLRKYIDTVVSTDKILQEFAVQCPEVMARLKDKLPTVADGDFSLVRYRVENIKGAVTEDDVEAIDKILDEPPEQDLDKIAEKILDELNSELKPHEIQQLNEVLKWVVYSMNPQKNDRLTLGQVEVIASLRTKKAAAQPFRTKIADRNVFANILGVEMRATDLWEFVVVNPDLLPTLRRMRKDGIKTHTGPTSEVKSRISLTISIENAEPDTVRRFLWDLSERASFDPFFFSNPRLGIQNKVEICLDPVESRITILEQSLKLLCEARKGINQLTWWALWFTPYHIRWAALYPDLYTDQRTLVRSLMSMLTEVDCTIQHWRSRPGLRSTWLRPSTVSAIRMILTRARDDHFDEYEPREQRMLQRLLEEPGEKGFFSNLTKSAAREWLEGHIWKASEAFKWIDGFLQPLPADSGSKLTKESNENELIDDNDLYISKEDENEDDGPKNDTRERIAAAADYYLKSLNAQSKPEARYYARLGGTYVDFSLYDEAIQVLDQAVAEEKVTALTRLSRALALAGKEDYEGAAAETEIALTDMRRLNVPEATASDRENARAHIREHGKNLAGWRLEMGDPESAAALYEEVISVAPDLWDVYVKLFEIWYRIDDTSRVVPLLTRMSEEKVDSISRLAQLFRAQIIEEALVSLVENLFALVKRTQTFQIVLNALDEAASYREDQRQTLRLEIASLRFIKGILLALQDRSPAGRTSAFGLWDQSLQTLNDSEFKDFSICGWAVMLTSQYHLREALVDSPRSQYHARQLEKLMLQHFSHYPYMLVNYHATNDRLEKAKNLTQNLVKQAVELLSDEDDENDKDAYFMLVDCFSKIGDDRNALSAASLMGPNKPALESESENGQAKTAQGSDGDADEDAAILTGPISGVCDGNCGRMYTYIDDIHICRMCVDTGFCSDCLAKLKDGGLEVFKCDPDHKWLHLPSWPEGRFESITEGGVLYGGTIIEGTWNREGAIVLTRDEWVDKIREDWQIEKPEKKATKEVNLDDEEEDEEGEEDEDDDDGDDDDDDDGREEE